ncbi:MAG: Sir2 family NAD-dependent protein deacetylase [Deltaproteobacteria bacterium]|nr:Sir2 family NAD-dependent protein deacetylase [Deltaproteobacteria bacterium]
MDFVLKKGMTMIEAAEKILVFTGAGLSTESGISDFRSPGGVWEKYDPSDFYFQKIISDTHAREKYWKMSSELYSTMKNAQPNTAHMAVKALEDAGKLLAVVTQNIDNLHHKAGNSPDKIIELHGTAFSVLCLKCGKTYDRDEIEHRLDAGIKAPCCDECGGILKPNTISFGQSMPQEKVARSFRKAEECDLCMVLGSSLVVQPAAMVPAHAAQSGAPLIIINHDPTPLDGEADLVINMSVTKALESMMGNLFHLKNQNR